MSFVIKLLSSLFGWTVTPCLLEQVDWITNWWILPFGFSHSLEAKIINQKLYKILLLKFYLYYKNSNYNDWYRESHWKCLKMFFIEIKSDNTGEFRDGLISWKGICDIRTNLKQANSKNNKQHFSYFWTSRNYIMCISIMRILYQNKTCEPQQWNQFSTLVK